MKKYENGELVKYVERNEKREATIKEYKDGTLVKFVGTDETEKRIIKHYKDGYEIDIAGNRINDNKVDRDQSILEAGRNRASRDTRRHELFGISNIKVDGLEYPDSEAIKAKSIELQNKVNNRFALDTTRENK